MGDIVQLFGQTGAGQTADDMLGALRRLDREALQRMLPAPGVPRMDAATSDPVLASCGGAGRVRALLTPKKSYWKAHRRAWRSLADMLDQEAGPEKLATAASSDHVLANLLALTQAGQGFQSTAVFPLKDGEAAVLQAASRLLEEERLVQEAAEAQARIARQNQAAEARRQAHERHEAEVARLVLEVSQGRGVARFRQVLALRDSKAAGHREAFSALDPALVADAVCWAEKRKAAAAAGRQRAAGRRQASMEVRRAQLAEEGRHAELPSGGHVVCQRTDDGFTATFQACADLTLGSAVRGGEARYRVRSRLSKARPMHLEDKAEVVTAVFGLADLEKLRQAVADIDEALRQLEEEPLTPRMAEEALHVTSAERLRWIKDGRLPTAGKDSFTKWGRTLEYWLHPAAAIAALRQEPATLAQWRHADLELSQKRRQTGARRGVQTRKGNEAGRTQVRQKIDEMAREIALAVRSPVALPVIKLAIMATMCSRWAKLYQERRNSQGRAEFYGLKDRILRVLVQQPWTTVSYVPAQAPRIEVDFCERHRGEFREDRRWSECSAADWAFDNRSVLRSCGKCSYGEDRDYYALYDVHMEAGDAVFSWHVPYPLGRTWLPRPESIPQLQAIGEPEEGLARFGRPIDEDEMVLWPAARLKREVASLLALFESDQGAGGELELPAQGRQSA